MTRPKVLIIGAGFAGFHCARELERLLRPSEAELTLASPLIGTLADQEATGQYPSADDARQTAARILAHDKEGWPT
jgi:NADH dehydrogenase FAD-containing subunit